MLKKYRRALVTGGAGFIGSHICDELLRLGKEVIVADNLYTGKPENIPVGAKFLELTVAEWSEMLKHAIGR